MEYVLFHIGFERYILHLLIGLSHSHAYSKAPCQGIFPAEKFQDMEGIGILFRFRKTAVNYAVYPDPLFFSQGVSVHLELFQPPGQVPRQGIHIEGEGYNPCIGILHLRKDFFSAAVQFDGECQNVRMLSFTVLLCDKTPDIFQYLSGCAFVLSPGAAVYIKNLFHASSPSRNLSSSENRFFL